MRILKIYYNFRPFTDPEAWIIFKIGAIAEACGWTGLITGILISKYITPGNSIAVQIAGHIHGTLFLMYIAGVIVVAPSLRFKLPKTVLAGLMSIPPYGTLAFEIWMAHSRKQNARQHLLNTSLYNQMLGSFN
jgi:integral membrane protein